MIALFPPMLATSADPFDSFEYMFEVKWDGVRALAAVNAHDWQLWGRELADYRSRYPELEVLRRLPAGTVVGLATPRAIPPRLVAVRGGCAEQEAIQTRECSLMPRNGTGPVEQLRDAVAVAVRHLRIGYLRQDMSQLAGPGR